MADPLLPFLKWAGGKRWLVSNYRWLFPSRFNCYVEPFLGGGAVMFALGPEKAQLSDANERLVACYNIVRDEPERLLASMKLHQKKHLDEAGYYYSVRARTCRSDVGRAAQLLYLNRTCWNGLYRVNLRGEFNVPKGTKQTVVFPGEDFAAHSRALKGARIRTLDFAAAIDQAKEGDFAFVDPPYTVKHNFNGFAKYNENIFSWNDQIRLRDALVAASERGVKILLSNADHESVVELFGDLGHVHKVSRVSLIAGESARRALVTEVAIAINYSPSPPVVAEAAKHCRLRKSRQRAGRDERT